MQNTKAAPLVCNQGWAPRSGEGLKCNFSACLSFYICTVIDSFCFSQPKRHNLRLCHVWPVATKLVDNKTKEHWFVHCYTNELTDNKTLFCHSEHREESLSFSLAHCYTDTQWTVGQRPQGIKSMDLWKPCTNRLLINGPTCNTCWNSIFNTPIILISHQLRFIIQRNC